MGAQLATPASRPPGAEDGLWIGIRSAQLFDNTFVATRGTPLAAYEELALNKPMSAEVCACHPLPIRFSCC